MAAWEKQVGALLKAGYRTITYDRRGFGKSSQPISGYDYDTFAADLHTIMTELDLRGVKQVGRSMGTGEVARYLGTFRSERVDKAVFVAPLPPFLLKTADNPEGVDGSIFDTIMQSIAADRFAYLSTFFQTSTTSTSRWATVSATRSCNSTGMSQPALPPRAQQRASPPG